MNKKNLTEILCVLTICIQMRSNWRERDDLKIVHKIYMFNCSVFTTDWSKMQLTIVERSAVMYIDNLI